MNPRRRRFRYPLVESPVPRKSVEALVEGSKARGHEVKIGGELFSDAMGRAGTYEGTYIGMIDHNVTLHHPCSRRRGTGERNERKIEMKHALIPLFAIVSSAAAYDVFHPAPTENLRDLSPDRPDTTESPARWMLATGRWRRVFPIGAAMREHTHTWASTNVKLGAFRLL